MFINYVLPTKVGVTREEKKYHEKNNFNNIISN
jgi:hypothetical protein